MQLLLKMEGWALNTWKRVRVQPVSKHCGIAWSALGLFTFEIAGMGIIHDFQLIGMAVSLQIFSELPLP
jgi:hypothetical protein